MPRTDDDVIQVLLELYADAYGGKEDQRFLIAWGDLRSVYGCHKLGYSRFDRLAEAAIEQGLYIIDLRDGENGHLVAVIKTRTVDRWRRVPRKLVEKYRMAPSEDGAEEEEDDEKS
jgi:hypothetical protein